MNNVIKRLLYGYVFIISAFSVIYAVICFAAGDLQYHRIVSPLYLFQELLAVSLTVGSYALTVLSLIPTVLLCAGSLSVLLGKQKNSHTVCPILTAHILISLASLAIGALGGEYTTDLSLCLILSAVVGSIVVIGIKALK